MALNKPKGTQIIHKRVSSNSPKSVFYESKESLSPEHLSSSSVKFDTSFSNFSEDRKIYTEEINSDEINEFNEKVDDFIKLVTRYNLHVISTDSILRLPPDAIHKQGALVCNVNLLGNAYDIYQWDNQLNIWCPIKINQNFENLPGLVKKTWKKKRPVRGLRFSMQNDNEMKNFVDKNGGKVLKGYGKKQLISDEAYNLLIEIYKDFLLEGGDKLLNIEYEYSMQAKSHFNSLNIDNQNNPTIESLEALGIIEFLKMINISNKRLLSQNNYPFWKYQRHKKKYQTQRPILTPVAPSNSTHQASQVGLSPLPFDTTLTTQYSTTFSTMSSSRRQMEANKINEELSKEMKPKCCCNSCYIL